MAPVTGRPPSKRIGRLVPRDWTISADFPLGEPARRRFGNIIGTGVEGPARARVLLLGATRSARELHDGLAQNLFAIGVTAKQLRDACAGNEAAQRHAAEIADLAQEGTVRLREALGALGGSGIALQGGLRAALERLAEETREVDVAVEVADELRDAGDVAADLLFRACREGVANTVRHAHARRCSVRCTADGSFLAATVEDDGVGMDESGSQSGFGLRFLREALAEAGGSLEVRSSAAGTAMTARVPQAR
jgi:signal transduction histidine kinase